MSPAGLLVTDVDSTLVDGEGIDLLAELAGTGAEVAAITERAMQGELDFRVALEQRVATLAGLPVAACVEVADALQLSDGAAELLAAAREAEWAFGLVSGGFHQTVDVLAERLGIELVLANRLEVSEGRLTGRTVGPVVDAAGKAKGLRRFAMRVGAHRTVAVGDGANDRDLLVAADVGIAYRAKPALQAVADVCIDDLREVIPHLAAVAG